MEPFTSAWQPAERREYLSQAGAVEDVDDIRKSTHTGRPQGTPEFVLALEKTLGRRLAPQKGGHPQSADGGAAGTPKLRLGVGRAFVAVTSCPVIGSCLSLVFVRGFV
jgi:hypothetical protein